MIKGCARGVADAGLYEYANKNCRAKKGAGAGDPDARAREHGHGLAGRRARREPELELIQAHMAQKPVLRVEVGARALRVR